MHNQRYFMTHLLNPKNDRVCDLKLNQLVVIGGTKGEGVIEDILPLERGQKKYQHLMTSKNTFDYLDHLIMPGFYDMHFHWVQDDVREMPKDSLLEWLEKYTFPAETKFENVGYAKRRARTFFKRLSTTGTIGGACYSSVHSGALAAAMAEARGDFVIGNVLMNMHSPAKLTQSEAESIQTVKESIKRYGRKYCLTPRFAITTTPEVMKEGGRLADAAECFKQTHLSETPNEIDFVLSIYRGLPGFEKVKSYTEIYKKVGMLGERSLMGHGIHLDDVELATLQKTGTCLVHCPTSNAPLKEKGLGSGLFDFRRVEAAKVKWALGSDIGGGPFLSMFDVMGSFVEQNRRKGIREASYVMALYRSTIAGAKVLGVGGRGLKKGQEASFIAVPVSGRLLKLGSAESILEGLIKPRRKQRETYDSMVTLTVHRGDVLHHRK